MLTSKVDENRNSTPGKKKGSRKTGGRKKGTPNKSSLRVEDFLNEKGVNLIDKMLNVAEKTEDLGLKYNVYKELMKYVYPQRKALDMQINNKPDVPIIEDDI